MLWWLLFSLASTSAYIWSLVKVVSLELGYWKSRHKDPEINDIIRKVGFGFSKIHWAPNFLSIPDFLGNQYIVKS